MNLTTSKIIQACLLASLLAAIAISPAYAAGDAAAGASKAAVCTACHGEGGNAPISPDYPRLAGQHADYIANALHDYQKGARKNPIMAGQVEKLTPQDINDLAAYFSSRPGSLTVKY